MSTYTTYTTNHSHVLCSWANIRTSAFNWYSIGQSEYGQGGQGSGHPLLTLDNPPSAILTDILTWSKSTLMMINGWNNCILHQITTQNFCLDKQKLRFTAIFRIQLEISSSLLFLVKKTVLLEILASIWYLLLCFKFTTRFLFLIDFLLIAMK